MGELDFEVLKMYGFDEEDIWDIMVIIGFFGFFNCMVNVIFMCLNDEFYILG